MGVACREEVKAGEVLIRVPEKLILSAAKAFEEPLLRPIFEKEEFFRDGQVYD